MKTIELSTAYQPFSAYAEEFVDEEVILTLNGRVIAVVIALKDLDSESLSLSTNPVFMAIIQQAREEFKVGKTVSLEEMKREMLL
jgi:PHD/YefM family antitoxin component YafN of YafNO toxin-antitoxin module